MAEVFRREGVDSDHPDDPGGKTRYGITEATARRHGYRVEQIDKSIAARIYRSSYWDVLKLDEIRNGMLAFELFDTGVNMGPGRAVEILQRAVNLIMPSAGLDIDGGLGPLTRGAVAKVERKGWARHLVAAFNGFQFDVYLELASFRQSYASFLTGWMIRCLPYEPEDDDANRRPPHTDSV